MIWREPNRTGLWITVAHVLAFLCLPTWLEIIFFPRQQKKSLDSAFWQKKFRLGRVTVNGDIFFLRLTQMHTYNF